MRQIPGGNTLAMINNLDDGIVAVLFRPQLNRRIRIGMPDSVGKQVVQNLLKPQRIGDNQPVFRRRQLQGNAPLRQQRRKTVPGERQLLRQC